jgi:formylglycine-generating enzyme required for sulfatase activity
MGDLATKRVFRVADRGHVEKRIAETQWQLRDYSDSEKTARLNEGINARYLIIGTISKLGTITVVDAMLEDLNSFEVIGNSRIRMDRPEDAYDLMEGFVSRLVENVTGPAAPVQTPVRPGTVPAGFVRVEGGTFRMGSANGGDDDERPVHTVTLTSFYMGKYEVTQKEWVEIMGANPSHFKGDTLPVEQVSWHDAIEYCNKRSLREGLTPAYRGSGDSVTCDLSASGYRLPTEAEWEYAAKGGANGAYLTYEYAGSNSVDGVGWYNGNSSRRTHPAGQKQPNDLGLYDMSGNVWEWCWDWYGNYPGGSQTDPVGPASGSRRVLRGGSWENSAPLLRSAHRGGDTPKNRYGIYGFRLVRR